MKRQKLNPLKRTAQPHIKGPAYEREICVDLSLWWTKGEREDVFWRTSMSGGRATIFKKKGRKGEGQGGDITAMEPVGLPFVKVFFIDSKHIKDLYLGRLIALASPKDGLGHYWDRIVTEAKDYDKLPFLIAKQNYYPPLLCLDGNGSDILAFDQDSNRRLPLRTLIPGLGLYIYWYKEFLDKADPDSVLEVYNDSRKERNDTKS